MTNPTRNAPVWATIVLAVLGVLLIVAGVVYLSETAGSLPSFFPGHLVGSAHKHTKHGIVALLAGVIALAGAWLSTGTKKTT